MTEVRVTARDENSVTYTVTGGEPGDTFALPRPQLMIPPVTRVVDQFTGRVVDTPEQQVEYLLERNAELTCRNQELEAENDELKATARLVISTIEGILAAD